MTFFHNFIFSLFQIRFVAEILTVLGCIVTLVVDCFEIGAQGFWSFVNNCVSIVQLYTHYSLKLIIVLDTDFICVGQWSQVKKVGL